MYSWTTKIYYRKTVGHVFTKPVQIEGTTELFIFPASCFSSQFTFLPLGNASVCSEKMVAPEQKSFCVLEYHTVSLWLLCNVHFVHSTQRTRPTDKTIRAWYKQFTETGCLCKQKSRGRPLTAEDKVERVRASFVTRGKHFEHL